MVDTRVADPACAGEGREEYKIIVRVYHNSNRRLARSSQQIMYMNVKFKIDNNSSRQSVEMASVSGASRS